jgi:hypothetical protein
MPIRRTWTAGATLLLTAPWIGAQWMHYPTPGVPRTQEGKPDLSAPARRRADGKRRTTRPCVACPRECQCLTRIRWRTKLFRPRA